MRYNPLRVMSIALMTIGSVICTPILAAKQPLTARDALETTRFMIADQHGRSIAVSPDGTRYAAMLIRGNVERDGVEVEIIAGKLDSVEGAIPYTVAKLFTHALGPTMHGKGDGARLLAPTTNFPVWLDDHRVAFLWEDEDGVHQVVAANVDTREWRFLTDSDTDVTGFSAGGRGTLIYEAKLPYSFEQSERLWQKGFTVKNSDAYSVLMGVIDGSTARDVLWGTGERYVMSSVERAPRARKLQVTNGGINTYPLAWPSLQPVISHDGRFALVSGTPQTIPPTWNQYEGQALQQLVQNWDRGRTTNARALQMLYVVSVDEATARPLWDAPVNPIRYPTRARWSPNGRAVVVWPVYLPLDDRDEDTTRGDAVAVVDVVTGAYMRLPVSREDAQRIEDVQWNRHDSVTLQIGDLYARFIERAGKWLLDREVEPAVASAGIRIELRQDPNTPPALYVVDDRAGGEQRVFDPNPQLRTRFALGEVEFIEWQDKDGHRREGRLFFPVGYQPSKRYPLVIQTHAWGRKEDFTLYGQGSPRATLGPNSSVYLGQPLAARGVMVLQVGPLGSARDQAPERDAVMEGFVSGIKHLNAKGLIDIDRVGIMGHSRAGWHTAYTLAFSDFPFRAAIVDDNIDSGYFEQAMMGWADVEGRNGQAPFGVGLADWLAHAPAFNVEHIRSPLSMMVTDSFAGRAAPLVMQWELFTRLRHLRKPVELFVIPNVERGAHNLQNPKQLLAQQERAVDWWLYWLKDERDPSEAKADQYANWDRLRELHDEDVKQPKPPRLRWTVEAVEN